MINDIKQDAQARMAKSIDALRHTLTTIRTGRASPALLDGIKVKAYGTDTPLNQVASISENKYTISNVEGDHNIAVIF